MLQGEFMLFIKIMLAALACFTGVFSFVALYLAARGRAKAKGHDQFLAAFVIAFILALGFLGLLLK